MAAALPSVTSSLSEESAFISTDSREGRLYTHSLSVDSTLSDDVWITSSSRFELEPSEVEDQLKESIQRLHTPGDERKEYNKGLMRTVMLYINPLGYFNNKNKQPEDGGWEIPFQDIRDLEYIGSGGQGTVFKGTYKKQCIAVKKVNEPKQTDIWNLRKLEHPNIVKFLGVCTKAPCYCIVMEYCSGGNLYHYMRQPGVQILPMQVITWAREIAHGMMYLHSKRIIHRDLKSLNVLIDDKNAIKISDFGACRFIDNHSTKITVIGSYAWMAPELIRNDPCNDKVDVWSYGILLWELLTQEEPYKNLNHAAIMFGVGSNKLQLPIPTNCPHDLRVLLESCWQQKPKNRMSFNQIIDQLEVVVNGPFLAYPPQNYLKLRSGWKNEITLHFDVFGKQLAERGDLYLVTQREEELKHAQEVRMMYEKKLDVAENLCEQLDTCKKYLDNREDELESRERELQEKYMYLMGLYSEDSIDDDVDLPALPKRNKKINKQKKTGKDSNGKIDPSVLDVFDHQAENVPILIPPQENVLVPIPQHESVPISKPPHENVLIPIPNNETDLDSPPYSPNQKSDVSSLKSESLITPQGDISPAVKSFISSVTHDDRRNQFLKGSSLSIPYIRASHTKHRRAVSQGSVPPNYLRPSNSRESLNIPIFPRSRGSSVSSNRYRSNSNPPSISETTCENRSSSLNREMSRDSDGSEGDSNGENFIIAISLTTTDNEREVSFPLTPDDSEMRVPSPPFSPGDQPNPSMWDDIKTTQVPSPDSPMTFGNRLLRFFKIK